MDPLSVLVAQNPYIARVLLVLAVVQVVASVLANVLPPNWELTKVCARLSLALPARWQVTPVPPNPPDPQRPAETPSPKPPTPPVPPLMLLGVLVLIGGTGCAGSFELARGHAMAKTPKASAQTGDRSYCEGLDGSRRTWNAIALAADTAGGSGVLGAVAAVAKEKDLGGPGLAVGLAVTGGALIVAGVVSHGLVNDYSNTWVRECSQ